MTDEAYKERCLKQHKAHTKNLPNGEHLIHIQGGLYDLFIGKGFRECIRIRLVGLADNRQQLIQVNGTTLSRDYRTYIFKELTQ